jgi:hypothetical protein
MDPEFESQQVAIQHGKILEVSNNDTPVKLKKKSAKVIDCKEKRFCRVSSMPTSILLSKSDDPQPGPVIRYILSLTFK